MVTGYWIPQSLVDQDHYHGVYSLNNRVFPFILKPYKYMCIRNRKDAILMWFFLNYLNQNNGSLLLLVSPMKKETWRIRKQVMCFFTWRTVLSTWILEEHEFIDDSVTQWQITYAIKKVLKLKRYKIDWDTFFWWSGINRKVLRTIEKRTMMLNVGIAWNIPTSFLFKIQFWNNLPIP